jgi:hypothetical protein
MLDAFFLRVFASRQPLTGSPTGQEEGPNLVEHKPRGKQNDSE